MIIKRLNRSDLNRLREIDRSEKVKILFRYEDGLLKTEKVDLDVPPWTENQMEKHMKALAAELENGGILLGALDDDLLAGMALLGSKLRGENHDMLQPVFLRVSKDYRRRKVATRLFDEMCQLAREKRARSLYISATPSESAVGFYLSRGCELMDKVDEELYALEP